MHKKSLLLLRGVPGSGKSTLAELLSESGKYPVFSVDAYFTNPLTGEYKFDYSKNYLAYAACQKSTEEAMKRGSEKIILDNTFVFDWETEPYYKLAANYAYTVFSLVVENTHGNKNRHDISDDDIAKIASKFKVKLI